MALVLIGDNYLLFMARSTPSHKSRVIMQRGTSIHAVGILLKLAVEEVGAHGNNSAEEVLVECFRIRQHPTMRFAGRDRHLIGAGYRTPKRADTIALLDTMTPLSLMRRIADRTLDR